MDLRKRSTIYNYNNHFWSF